MTLATLTTTLLCDTCGMVATDYPEGWLIISSRGIGLSTALDHKFCPVCKLEVIRALGYKAHKDYLSMVKAYSELERSLEVQAMKQRLAAAEVPFYLFDDEIEW